MSNVIFNFNPVISNYNMIVVDHFSQRLKKPNVSGMKKGI